MGYIPYIGLLFLYCILLSVFGWKTIQKLFGKLPIPLHGISAWLFGTAVGVPVTYLVSCIFKRTNDPIMWGVLSTIMIGSVSSILLQKIDRRGQEKIEVKPFLMSDIFIIIFSFVFSVWIMTKTFHGGSDGVLYVGSNNVFDFSHALGIIRSFSFGSNIPFTSPFQAGLPFFYHFLFYFYVATWEHLGVPIIWAMNIPSVLSMTSLLVIVYYLPQLLFQQKPLVGWIVVLLSITNSTLTFWQLLLQKGVSLVTIKSLWQLPTYLFAGPFDGSTISIFTTLNSYVNQRHLSFAIAFGFLLFLLVDAAINQKRLNNVKTIFLGFLTGLLFYWNVFIFLITAVLIGVTLLVRKQWRYVCLFSVFAILLGVIFCVPYTGLIQNMMVLIGRGVGKMQTWNAAQYLWQNLGLLPLGIMIGWFTIPKIKKSIVLPLIFLFTIECVYATVNHHGFDQKFYSFLIILVNCVAAIGVVWLWEKKKVIWKFTAVTGLFVLTISGMVDLIPIKNEFAFPIVNSENRSVIIWIKDYTSKNAVFVSYSDMIDPVVLAGRKNYFGFFGNACSVDRSSDVGRIYAGDADLVDRLHIAYILVPKWKKNDFQYIVDDKKLTAKQTVVYEDEKYRIYSTVVK